MSRDIGLYISAKDNYTNTISKMSQFTRTFTSDMGGCQQKLDMLNKNKVTLQIDATKAKSVLAESRKEYAATGTEAARLQMEADQADYNNIADNLKLVTEQASRTRKEMTGLTDDLSKAQNRGKSTGTGDATLLSKLSSAGLIKMVGDVASEAANTIASSGLGSEGGTIFSNVISKATTGAAIGSIIPGIGTLVGAAVGTVTGATDAAIQIFNARDDAFKGVVQESYDSAVQAQSEVLSAGSALAASRETNLISWSTLLGGQEKAVAFTNTLKDMANTTPFLYDDLNQMAKALKTYGYSAEEIVPTLTAIGDAGATLGMSTADMTSVATALGRMRLSDKTSAEYLNQLIERGIPAYDYLAKAMGTTKQDVMQMVTDGLIPGSTAAQVIADAMEAANKGGMELQSQTYEGLTSTVEGLTENLNAAMGEAYNEERKKGLQEQVDYLGGETGSQMEQAYAMVGQWQASLENSKDQLQRDAMSAVMGGDISGSFTGDVKSRLEQMQTEYLQLQQEYESGNTEAGAKMGALIAEAQVIANNEYLSSDGYKLEQETQLQLIDNIREDTALNDAYYMAGYTLGQSFSKGRADATTKDTSWAGSGLFLYEQDVEGTYTGGKPNAWGLQRVPYDNYPAVLHEGERVLTAAEARQRESSPQIVISGNSFTVREDADIDKIARALVRELQLASMVS